MEITVPELVEGKDLILIFEVVKKCSNHGKSADYLV